jgi:transketolase
MRQELIRQLIKKDDKNTYFITADLGFGVLEPLQKKMGDRFINVGIAEQSMIGIAAGLALAGKKVYTFTITPFYLRALEQIKLDLCYQGANVIMIGVGVDYDYGELGTTHFADDTPKILSQLKNIEVILPSKKNLGKVLKHGASPRFIGISRFGDNENFYGYINDDQYDKEGGSKEYFLKKHNVDG